jgi:GNAT superfamily N-acetyltransferase
MVASETPADDSGEPLRLRAAALSDVADLEALIARSARSLQLGDYTAVQIEAALNQVFGVDRQLIADGGYRVIEQGRELVACGGWSRRRTLFGADAAANRDDELLDPLTEPAKIRAFFVDPRFARRGLASRLLAESERAAAAYGFSAFELGATLTGQAFYLRHGYRALETIVAPLSQGQALTLVRMTKGAAEGADRGGGAAAWS